MNRQDNGNRNSNGTGSTDESDADCGDGRWSEDDSEGPSANADLERRRCVTVYASPHASRGVAGNGGLHRSAGGDGRSGADASVPASGRHGSSTSLGASKSPSLGATSSGATSAGRERTGGKGASGRGHGHGGVRIGTGGRGIGDDDDDRDGLDEHRGVDGGFDGRETQTMKPGRRGGVVVALRKASTGETFTLGTTRQRWLLGSSPSSDLCIVDPFVSGTHCLLERRGDGALLVRDRESRNGTYIDGNPVEGAELRVGSYLAVGRTTLVAVASVGDGGAQPRAIEMLRGRDPVIRLGIDQAIRAAHSECSVLILGETGTGKDLMARLIHESSRRAEGPFVAVNCGGIPRELIASELFGHERGSFTGAAEARDGYFVEANGGTLFLDEIGELPLELQPHLLRVLETRRVRRVGGQAEVPVDVRIVAATNRLDGAGPDASRLRLDLYHRLATVVLTLPPLRERMSDLVELVETMMKEHESEYGVKRVSPAGWKALASYTWPGNVRELRHAIARAVALGGEELGPADFFPDLASAKGRIWREQMESESSLVPYEAMLRGAMAQALQAHGTIRGAAQSLGMPKSTFADKAKHWGLMTKRRPRLPTAGK